MSPYRSIALEASSSLRISFSILLNCDKISPQHLPAEAVISGRTVLSGIVMSVLKAMVSTFLSMMAGEILFRIRIIIVAYPVIVQVLEAVPLFLAPGTSADVFWDRGDGSAQGSSAACVGSCADSSSCTCSKYCGGAQNYKYCSDDESFHKFLHKNLQEH